MRARAVTVRVAILLLSFTSAAAVASERQDARLSLATEVLTELMQMPEDNIPAWLLQRSYAIAVVPDVIKVGLIVAGRRGKGVLTVRNDSGEWTNPVFVNLTGGSVGFQAGVQSTDIVLVFTSRKSIEGIVGGKVTLGADLSVAAGPVGRHSSAATDIGLNAQVYSYSRASGLFAGIALDGSALTIDDQANEAFYGRPGVLASEIVSASAPAAPAPAPEFIAAVERAAAGLPAATPVSASTSASTPPEPAADATATVPAAQSGPQQSGLITYPIEEDPQPGREPPE